LQPNYIRKKLKIRNTEDQAPVGKIADHYHFKLLSKNTVIFYTPNHAIYSSSLFGDVIFLKYKYYTISFRHFDRK